MSASRLTQSPTASVPNVVTWSVCGTIATAKPSSYSSATVRLTPATVTLPFSIR
jgi:hypothetical protein